ncbi:MAG: urease accessory protein UreD [Pseudomonadota bacterium]
MLDTTTRLPVKMQRAHGRAEVSLKADGGRVRLGSLHQSGSAKAFLPVVHSDVPEVVFLNTAGGLTGGDRMRFALSLAPGTRATATTQTAERAYASAAGVADMQVDLQVGDGAHLDWLPQETILFENAGLHRKTQIALQGDASVLMVETVVLGRAAMGEMVTALDFHDQRHVTRDGVPVLMEPLRFTANLLASAGLATHGGHRAFTTIALVAPGAEDAVEPVRRMLPAGLPAAASGWDGKCVIRATAPDAWPLRQAIAPILTHLRKAAPLPRVWQL